MSQRVLLRDYTVEEMDRGVGMKFHPCADFRHPRVGGTFKPFDDHSMKVLFDAELHAYVKYFGDSTSKSLGRIGDGISHSAGMPFLPHWTFDPYTCEYLGEDPPCCGGEW